MQQTHNLIWVIVFWSIIIDTNFLEVSVDWFHIATYGVK